MAKKTPRGWGQIRKLPSGRFQASYVGPDHHRHNAPATYSTRGRAEGFLADARRCIELGTWAASSTTATLTVNTYGTAWIGQRPLKPRTRSLYEGLFRLHIAPALGEYAITELTPTVVRAWYADLGTEHPTRNAHAYGLLRSICATAVDDKVLTTNPCAIKRVGAPKRKREPVILTPSEVAALADAVPAKYKAMILLAAWCGTRWGEVTELRRGDVSSGCEKITVARAVNRRDGKTWVDTTKGGRVRTVSVPDHIRADVKHHLDNHTADDADALLFMNAKGEHLNNAWFGKTVLRPALAKIGRQGVTFHMLRHFAGTYAAVAGATLPELMRRLGHSTPRAAMLYQQAVDGRDAQIAAALSKLAEGDGSEHST